MGWLKASLLFFILTLSASAYAARDITLGYQGVIQSGDEFLDGTTGFFKFAICSKDCDVTYWSNDGTSNIGEEPVAGVAAPIVGGVFNVLLGDTSITNMDAIPLAIFQAAGDENLYLRVWFDDGANGYEQFFPDQRVAVAPYAVKAEISGDLNDVGSIEMAGNLGVVTRSKE